MTNVIGGEFAIDLQVLKKPISYDLERKQVYSNGRIALYNILLYLNKTKKAKQIFVPDYLCESVLKAISKAGYKYQFYNLGETLNIDENSFKAIPKYGDVVLVVNFFGLINTHNEIQQIKSFNNVFILLDNVQAFYELDEHLYDVDFSFTSLRKAFGVPSGAIVKTTKHTTFYESQKNMHGNFETFKLLGGISKNFGYVDDDLFLYFINKGEKLIDLEYQSTGVSDLTFEMIRRLPYTSIMEKRKKNANYICEKLKELEIKLLLPYNKNKTPLFIPILIDNRDSIRQKMFDNNIFTPIHWPSIEGERRMKKSLELYDKELSLIVDQRYTESDLDKMLYILSLQTKTR